jgi:hypothetical protein
LLYTNLINKAKEKTADKIYSIKIKNKNKYKKNNNLFYINCKKINYKISNYFFLYKEKRPKI